MTGDPPTALIERGELRVLVEASRDTGEFAHVIRRPRAPAMPKHNRPSALRGVGWLLGLAWLTRELVHFFV
jgi:hypothetical protein